MECTGSCVGLCAWVLKVGLLRLCLHQNCSLGQLLGFFQTIRSTGVKAHIYRGISTVKASGISGVCVFSAICCACRIKLINKLETLADELH